MFVNNIAIKSRRNISSLVSSSIRRKLSSCKLESQLKYFSTAATHEFEDDVDTDPVKLDCNKTSWQAEHNMDIQRVTQKAIIHELTQQQTKTIEDTVPWFLNQMPNSYFRSVPEHFRMDHIKALSAIQDANMDLHLNLKSHLPDGQLVLTYIRPGKEAGRILNLVKDLPWTFDSEEYLPLSRVQVFTSEDETMSLSIFVYGGNSSSPASFDVRKVGKNILDYANQIQNDSKIEDHEGYITAPSSIFEESSLIEYLQKCDESYVARSSPRRFLKQRELFEMVSGTECMAVSIEKSHFDSSSQNYWVDIAVANSLPQIALENAVRVLYQHNFDVVRSHLDMISDNDNGSVCMLRLLVSPLQQEGVDIMTGATMNKIIHELKRTKWLDPKTMELVFKEHPWIGLPQGEIVTAFCALLHPIMTKRNPYAYSMANIQSLITSERYIKHAALIAELFLAKFDPEKNVSTESFNERSQIIADTVCDDVEDTVAKELLLKMIDIVKCTLRTNVFIENRYSLGLRLDPRVMEQEENEREIPFGIIFSHGRRFNAFHVRFRDIARGGMRLVTPTNQEQHALESARQYDECYNLAYSQQLKNKDIPEGGSKAVNLINCHGLSEEAKQFVMRKSVKAFTNTLLDLVVEYDDEQLNQVDYLGKKEVLYLGPDEQVTNDDIDWIVKRAGIRGYETPNAFMSSKPLSGINHKEYGVTSEGVNTYLDVALREVLGINPSQNAFTVKMTGGPDGDVAGNEIKILIREYGENVKIVGISDISGCAEDPNGLDHNELLRLVDEGLCISNFTTSKLTSDGQVYLADNEEGINKRNTMHNRLIADAFIPAGGRPSTIDMTNYKKYLQDDGSPSASLIVEGANLFISSEARQALYDEAGVMIVKDSSANKCGVITSSYEICSAMLLDENEFFENKEAIVEEVIGKLKALAKLEAQLLFKEYEDTKVSLPEVSKRISNSINCATDVLIAALGQMSDTERESLLPIFQEHLPKTLADLAYERVQDTVPKQYVINGIASHIASKMVYNEGCEYIDSLPHEKLMNIAFKYITKEREVASLRNILTESNVPDDEKELMLQILDKSGVRTALMVDTLE